MGLLTMAALDPERLVWIPGHKIISIQRPVRETAVAVPDLLKVYMQPAVIALAERIESDLLGLYSQFTSNTPVGSVGTPLVGTIDAVVACRGKA